MMLRLSRKQIVGLLGLALVILGALLFWQPGLTILLLGVGIVAAGTLIGVRGFVVAWQRRRRHPELAYLPSLPFVAGQSVFRTDFCQVHVDAAGVLRICDRDGEPLVVGICYYTETNRYQSTGLSGVACAWTLDGTDTVVTIAGHAGPELVTLDFRFAAHHAAVAVRTRVVYQEPVEVHRSALCWDLAVPLREIYRPSGARVRRDFAPCYWLDRQGALFGAGPRTVFLAHVPEVSSVQVDTARRRLWINLDYERDHPYVSIPHMHDGTAHWQDASSATHGAGAERANAFAIWIGAAPALRPRLSCHPHGFLASFVWTEHACNTALETQRAVFLGHSNLRTLQEASAGFVKHGIPITKSVHYSNTQNANLNNQGSPWKQRPMLAIRSGNADFLDLLDALHATSLVEICLHCTDPISASRAEIEASFAFMQARFASVSWIDHIWWRPTASVSGCRECITCEGPLAGKPGFVADLWERYGIKYFWNNTWEYANPYFYPVDPAASNPPLKRVLRKTAAHLKRGRLLQAGAEFWEQIFLRQEAQRKRAEESRVAPPIAGEVDYEPAAFGGTMFHFKQLATRELGFPNPRYFRHPTRTGSAVHWPTFHGEDGDRTAAQWRDRYSDEELTRFSDSGETYFAHAYPTWAGAVNGCVVMEPDGACRISPEFDGVLERMAHFKQAGKINFTTVRQLLDHWRLLEQVEFVHEPDGSVRIVNHSEVPIHGLTLVCATEDVEFDIAEVSRKPSSRGSLFWFDLPAQGCVTLWEKGQRGHLPVQTWPAKKCA